MTFDLELLIRSVSTVKHADTRSMFQLILNNLLWSAVDYPHLLMCLLVYYKINKDIFQEMHKGGISLFFKV